MFGWLKAIFCSTWRKPEEDERPLAGDVLRVPRALGYEFDADGKMVRNQRRLADMQRRTAEDPRRRASESADYGFGSSYLLGLPTAPTPGAIAGAMLSPSRSSSDDRGSSSSSSDYGSSSSSSDYGSSSSSSDGGGSFGE